MKLPRKIKKSLKYIEVLSTKSPTLSNSTFHGIISYGVKVKKYRTKYVRQAKKYAYSKEMNKLTKMFIDSLKDVYIKNDKFNKPFELYSWDIIN